MPLTMAGIGETNTISRIGGNEETRRFPVSYTHLRAHET